MRISFDEAGARVARWDLDAGPAPDAFRAAMRRVVGGVAVVATLRESRPWGMTVSAFTPVCMEPPTLLVCVNAATATAADIARDRKFSLNLLSEAQRGVSQRCAQQGASKYLDEDAIPAANLPPRIAMPVLQDSVATFDCDASEIRRIGTHVVVVGAIRAILAPQARRPLLYGQGGYLRSVTLDAATGALA
ncbi:flavin reductase family protein [Bradyrhizobium lablabi]|uniref:flavin reductase family protein n=1 Tax=Bradyrhizobium lablabi TaxID=722472 RepID=UPI001BA5C6E6|nr:flavin reductase family protein [Bradyrhizobium lablabi]MBR0691747.1 flavin reductase family protein [Bradyrhizobium lablabi]